MVDETAMIRTQRGMHNKSDMAAVYGYFSFSMPHPKWLWEPQTLLSSRYQERFPINTATSQ
jgi:hypothetical protein